MDIFLYGSTGGNIIFPVIPQKIEVQSPQKIETFESLGQGDLKIIGLKGNRTFALESFFPVNDYPFLKDRTYKGMEYVDIIERWRSTKQPLTVAISDLKINFKCVIENFNYAIQDGSGDIYYKLDIEEYKTPLIIKTSTKIVTTVPVKFSNNAYGIVINKKGASVMSGPGLNYTKVGALTYGTKIKVWRVEGEWLHIYFGKQAGHIKTNLVKRV